MTTEKKQIALNGIDSLCGWGFFQIFTFPSSSHQSDVKQQYNLDPNILKTMESKGASMLEVSATSGKMVDLLESIGVNCTEIHVTFFNLNT